MYLKFYDVELPSPFGGRAGDGSSLRLCSLASFARNKNVQKVGHSRLPMLVFSPIIKEGEFA